MYIINVRGSHGSGKSWVVRQVMATLPPGTPFLEGKKIMGYDWDKPPLSVIGRYSEASTGGCDTIKDINDVERVVLEQASADRHVLFEGIRVTAGHDRWKTAAWHNKQHNWYFIILNTTKEQCLENIAARRTAAGLEPAGPTVAVSVADHWARCQRQRSHFANAGLRMEYMSSTDAVECIKELIA